jgi:hypothetical protein
MTVKEAAKLALDGTESAVGPRKYLNCVISYASDATGKEVVSGGKCATAQVTLTIANTGYTSWQEGDVTLCDAEGNLLVRLPALAQGERTTVTVTLPTGGAQIRACAEGVWFGTEFIIKK